MVGECRGSSTRAWLALVGSDTYLPSVSYWSGKLATLEASTDLDVVVRCKQTAACLRSTHKEHRLDRVPCFVAIYEVAKQILKLSPCSLWSVSCGHGCCVAVFVLMTDGCTSVSRGLQDGCAGDKAGHAMPASMLWLHLRNEAGQGKQVSCYDLSLIHI